MSRYPPSWPGPILVSDSERAEVDRLRDALDDAIRALDDRINYIIQHSTAAWIAWHDRHGWPRHSGDGYRSRMRAATTYKLIDEARRALEASDD